MIDSKELRIGNLIDNLGDIEEVTNISLSGISTNKELHPQDEDLEPIPITEEWLLKFGFGRNGFGNFHIDFSPFLIGYKVLKITRDFKYIYIVEGLEEMHKSNDVVIVYNKDVQKEMFVHQLQNLYFALTGKELETKEL